MTGRAASLAADLQGVIAIEPVDLARAALVIARLEYPDLDPAPSLARLDELGARAAQAVRPLAGAPTSVRLAAIADQLYGREGFAGNRAHYDDFRNSFLNAVSSAGSASRSRSRCVYIEVARRAGVEAHGVSFPGHFLLRGPDDDADERPLILDPFDGGRPLGESDLRALLARMVGDDAPYSPICCAPARPASCWRAC